MTQPPQIVVGYGVVNPDYAFSDHGGPLERFVHKHLHRDLSTIMVTPTRGNIPARVVDSWLSMLKAPNQRFGQLMAAGMEVGAAYDALVHMILADPELSRWKYMLTVEEDNLPHPMAFVDLVEEAEENDWDVLGGLYYVKGPCGFPQIWGQWDDPVENYRPQVPVPGEVVRCQGTGMGFTLYRIDRVFRRIKPPWFVSEVVDGSLWTQDLYLSHVARQQGIDLKIGVHCGVRVGHLDSQTGDLW